MIRFKQLFSLFFMISLLWCVDSELAGCIRREEPPQPAPQHKEEDSKGRLTRISYYGKGDGTRGRKTAAGEPFDPSKLTAAHRTLPFGSRVKLTNPKNGNSVIVTINDRGPAIKGREFDVSEAAARQLGIEKRGAADVYALVQPN